MTQENRARLKGVALFTAGLALAAVLTPMYAATQRAAADFNLASDAVRSLEALNGAAEATAQANALTEIFAAEENEVNTYLISDSAHRTPAVAEPVARAMLALGTLQELRTLEQRGMGQPLLSDTIQPKQAAKTFPEFAALLVASPEGQRVPTAEESAVLRGVVELEVGRAEEALKAHIPE